MVAHDGGAQAITRAPHSFVRKHLQYALMGEQGRKRLYLYEPGDSLSTMWAKMSVEQRTFVSRSMDADENPLLQQAAAVESFALVHHGGDQHHRNDGRPHHRQLVYTVLPTRRVLQRT